MPWGWAGKEVMWDQHIFNDVVETFAWGKHIERRSGRCLIENAKRDAWERERGRTGGKSGRPHGRERGHIGGKSEAAFVPPRARPCLLYTSDAADE